MANAHPPTPLDKNDVEIRVGDVVRCQFLAQEPELALVTALKLPAIYTSSGIMIRTCRGEFATSSWRVEVQRQESSSS